jgi:hypothetical protein
MKFESFFGRTMGRGALAFLAALAAGLVAATPAPALAQGTLNTIQKPQTNAGCPPGWRDRPKDVSITKAGYDTCFPDTGAKKAYAKKSQSEACAPGYIGNSSYCYEGKATFTQATAGPLTKAHPLDRCPVGWVTPPSNGNVCTTIAPNPPKARLKGEGSCNAGELEDWGIYCVSDYDMLARKDAAKGTLDYNGIYQTSFKTTGKQQASHTADLPEGTAYTPAYFLIFGRVDRDGNPFPGGASAALAGSAANPAATAEAAVKRCVPKPKKKGLGGALGGLAKEVAAELGVPAEDGC